MVTSILARRSRAALSALALLSAVLGTAPPPSDAAATRAPAAAKSSTTRAAVTSKAAAKKQPAKRTGYHPRNGPAPADEYFGRLQMSILGVRNKVKDLGLDTDIHPERGNANLNGALWVEDAMRDWAKKYPFDRWLPRYAYALEQMYERIPGENAHRRAVKQISYLTAYFPQTVYGRIGRAKLAQGVPTPDPSATPEIETELQRLALLDGKVIPTIPPAATPTPSPTPQPATETLPESTPAASATALPAPPVTARPR